MLYIYIRGKGSDQVIVTENSRSQLFVLYRGSGELCAQEVARTRRNLTTPASLYTTLIIAV